MLIEIILISLLYVGVLYTTPIANTYISDLLFPAVKTIRPLTKLIRTELVMVYGENDHYLVDKCN